MKKVTLEQIAKELNLSKGIVSLAIRNKYGVNEETRSRVILKALEMGYNFSYSPSKGSKNIILVVKNMNVLNEEFWRNVIVGVERELSKNGFVFSILSLDSSADNSTFTIDAFSRSANGIILLNQCPKEIIISIYKLGVPLVLLDMVSPVEGQIDQVMANNFEAGLQAVNHLIKKNHKKIIIFGNPEYSVSFQQRYFGCVKALERAKKSDNDIEYVILDKPQKIQSDDDVYENDDLIICNPNDLRDLLKENGDYSIVCLNDVILRYTLRVLKELNLKVPDDISLISFDNTSVSIDNNITSINIDKIELGKQATKLLIGKINDPRNIAITVELSVSLIERNSVKDKRY